MVAGHACGMSTCRSVRRFCYPFGKEGPPPWFVASKSSGPCAHYSPELTASAVDLGQDYTDIDGRPEPVYRSSRSRDILSGLSRHVHAISSPLLLTLTLQKPRPSCGYTREYSAVFGTKTNHIYKYIFYVEIVIGGSFRFAIPFRFVSVRFAILIVCHGEHP